MEQNKFFYVFTFIVLPFLSHAQQKDSSATVTPVNKKKLHAFVIGGTAMYAGSLVGLNELWYKQSPHQSFSFFNDDAEWKQMDKIGHFYSAFYISYATSRALQWCNVKQTRSNLMGALTGFMIMAPIEVFDGYSSAYGASAGDLLADAGGAAFYLAQTSLWKEVRIWPKFSFHTTSLAPLRPNVLGDTWASEILKDYNGQTHWLSFDVDKFITFPKWLNLAVGYGAQNMVYARNDQNIQNGYDSYRQYYLSIDFDLTAVHTNSKTVKTILSIINMIKIPAPAFELSRKGTKMHWFYF